MSFPSAPEMVTPEWLTIALRETDAIGKASVQSFDAEQVGEGVGFLGQLVRIKAKYDHHESGAPSSLIGKFPAADEENRQVAALYGVYSTEVNFYREVASAITMRTPRCYVSAMNDSGTEFVLLLEDLSATGRIGDQVAGCTLDEARLALAELATFHASWWQDEALERMTWLPPITQLHRTSASEAYPQNWKPCLERFGHLFSPEIQAAAPSLNAGLLTVLDRFEQAPRTMLHADYRLDNLFFGTSGSDYELAVIDWQIAGHGGAAYDVAYFIALNLEPDVRRQHEDELLGHYHQVLVQQGVRDYSLAALRDDYTRSILISLSGFIGNVTSIDPANERGEELFALLLGRSAKAVMDLGALDLLPKAG